MNVSTRTSRRLIIAGIAALASSAVALREIPSLLRRVRSTPYDDLLSAIGDRGAAEAFGRQAVKAIPQFDAHKTASLLRGRTRDRSLQRLFESELETNRIVEISGWVVPESLAFVCALASAA